MWMRRDSAKCVLKVGPFKRVKDFPIQQVSPSSIKPVSEEHSLFRHAIASGRQRECRHPTASPCGSRHDGRDMLLSFHSFRPEDVTRWVQFSRMRALDAKQHCPCLEALVCRQDSATREAIRDGVRVHLRLHTSYHIFEPQYRPEGVHESPPIRQVHGALPTMLNIELLLSAMPS